MATDQDSKSAVEQPSLLVYGWERVSGRSPADLQHASLTIQFEPYDTGSSFSDFDLAVIPQGVFEKFERVPDFRGSHLHHEFDRDELDKRDKQALGLLKNKGCVCFLLHDGFIDSSNARDFRNTDLAKRWLNAAPCSRTNFVSREPHLASKRNEFRNFFSTWGAAWTFFEFNYGATGYHPLAAVGRQVVSFLQSDGIFFVPCLIPEQDQTDDFFISLGRALVATRDRLDQELPAWADEFTFDKERELLDDK